MGKNSTDSGHRTECAAEGAGDSKYECAKSNACCQGFLFQHLGFSENTTCICFTCSVSSNCNHMIMHLILLFHDDTLESVLQIPFSLLSVFHEASLTRERIFNELNAYMWAEENHMQYNVVVGGESACNMMSCSIDSIFSQCLGQ